MISTETEKPLSTALHCLSAFVYYEDKLETPICVKIPCGTYFGQNKPYVTLAMFKDALATLPKPGNYRYFFKECNPKTLAARQWEATNDNQQLPLFKGKVIAYLKTKNEPILTIKSGQNSNENLASSSTLSSKNQQSTNEQRLQLMEPSSAAPHFAAAYVRYTDTLETPHVVRIPGRKLPESDKPFVSLGMLKQHLRKQGDFCYFFKKQCPITKATYNWAAFEDDQELPLVDGRINALLTEKNQSFSILNRGQYRNENTKQSASALDLSSGLDDQIRESAGEAPADINEMRELVAKMQAVVKCSGDDAKNNTTITATETESTVDDSEAANALRTLKSWVMQNKVKGQALVHLDKFEDNYFSDQV